jgi:hypothetical protein
MSLIYASLTDTYITKVVEGRNRKCFEALPIINGPGNFVRSNFPSDLIRLYSIVGSTTHRFEVGIELDA